MNFWGVLGALLIGTGLGRMAGASNALLAPQWTIALGVVMWVGSVIAGFVSEVRKMRREEREQKARGVVTTTIREEKR